MVKEMLDDDRRLDCRYCSATQQQTWLRLRGDVKGGVWVWCGWGEARTCVRGAVPVAVSATQHTILFLTRSQLDDHEKN